MSLVSITINKPLVAICVPAYEKIECIQRLIKSIQNQTYDNYIVIITDDSRTKYIEEYIGTLKNSKIFYQRNSKQVGASGNTNNAINWALKKEVKIIKLMHQDDWFTYKNSLEKMIYELSNTAADVIFTGNFEVYPDKIIEHICSKEQIERVEKDTSFLFRANCLGAPSNVLYKADAVFFDSAYTWLLDVDFYLRLLPKKKFKYIFEPLISIGHDGKQLTDFYTKNPRLRLKETFRQYKKYKWLHSKCNCLYLFRYAWDCYKLIIKKNIKKSIKRK